MLDYVEGNRLMLLHNGAQYFPVLVAAIDAARSEVFLETYIFADDQTGSLVADALARAGSRGVATHLLVDGFGARDFAPRFRSMLEDAGVEILVFRRQVSPWPFWKQRSRLRRMHRKLVSIDGAIALVGGINVIDDYDTPGQTPPRFDYAVRIEGPLAARARSEAARLWKRVAWANFGRSWPGLAVVRDNLRHRRDIENAYLELIGTARSEVLIANAYFFPVRRFRRALAHAARRNVSVGLLLQARAEYPLQHYASRALYRAMLAAGVRIHEYYRSFLHAKVAVFDGSVATVGSSNIDPFSLGLAQEANVFVDDPRFAAQLRASLEEAIALGARLVPRNYWQRLSLGLKARIWFSYRIARLLMAVWGFDRLR